MTFRTLFFKSAKRISNYINIVIRNKMSDRISILIYSDNIAPRRVENSSIIMLRFVSLEKLIIILKQFYMRYL